MSLKTPPIGGDQTPTSLLRDWAKTHLRWLEEFKPTHLILEQVMGMLNGTKRLMLNYSERYIK